MGADIHVFVEKKDTSDLVRWEFVPDITYKKRHYGLFALLAGVRNHSHVPIHYRVRGLPPDYSEKIEDELFYWDSEEREPSFLRREEILGFDYDESFEDLRDYTDKATRSSSLSPGQGVVKTYREFLPEEWFAFLKELETIQARHVRIVFWFDGIGPQFIR